MNVSPDTEVTGPLAVVRTARGEIRLHARSCRDAVREARNNGHRGTTVEDLDGAATLGAWASSAFGDWHRLAVDLVVLPCALRCLDIPDPGPDRLRIAVLAVVDDLRRGLGSDRSHDRRLLEKVFSDLRTAL